MVAVLTPEEADLQFRRRRSCAVVSCKRDDLVWAVAVGRWRGSVHIHSGGSGGTGAVIGGVGSQRVLFPSFEFRVQCRTK